MGHDDAIPLDEAEPPSYVPREVCEVPIDDSEEQDRVRGIEPIEQALDRRLDGIGDGRAPGEEGGDEEDRRLVALRFDEELHARRFHRPRGIANERREVERLDVEPFEVVKGRGADVALTETRFAADEHARAEDAQSLESWQNEGQKKQRKNGEGESNSPCIIFSFSNPPLSSSHSASSSTFGRLTSGRTMARAFLAASKASARRGTSCGGMGAAGEEVARAVEGMRSASRRSQYQTDPRRTEDSLFCETMKSRAVTSIVSGLITSRSFVL